MRFEMKEERENKATVVFNDDFRNIFIQILLEKLQQAVLLFH
jgi:hypothetical protein